MSEARLEASGLAVHYGRVRATSDVSLAVGAGELVVLLGGNGAGKTTTLRALSGLVEPSAGSVRVDGRDLTGQPPERFSTAGVAHIVEGRGVFGRLTVEQNLVMGLYPRRRERPDRAAELERVLELFDELRPRLGQRAGSLSGGEQQMLAVARALVSRPRYLLLDEPSHGLAPLVVDRLYELLARLRADGLGLLVVEQYVNRALGLADRACVLERGRVTYEGNPTDLVEDRLRLTDAYLGGEAR